MSAIHKSTDMVNILLYDMFVVLIDCFCFCIIDIYICKGTRKSIQKMRNLTLDFSVPSFIFIFCNEFLISSCFYFHIIAQNEYLIEILILLTSIDGCCLFGVHPAPPHIYIVCRFPMFTLNVIKFVSNFIKS